MIGRDCSCDMVQGREEGVVVPEPAYYLVTRYVGASMPGALEHDHVQRCPAGAFMACLAKGPPVESLLRGSGG